MDRVKVAASPAVGRDGSIYITDYGGFLHAFTGDGGCPMGHYLSFDPGIASDIVLYAPCSAAAAAAQGVRANLAHRR